MNKIIECVPHFSEGRDKEKIEKIVECFRGKDNVKLLDYSNDEDHNRLVVTVVGEPAPLRDAVIEAIGVAVKLIDLNKHSGQHPRMGAVDVVPFIPIKNTTMDEAIALSKEVAEQVAQRYALPVFLYEKSASAPHRENLAAVRKGEFEGMAEKIKQPEWRPDFGPAERHATAGTVAIGARMPLVAYNVNLNTDNQCGSAAIRYENNKALIDPEICKDCGHYIEACPFDALSNDQWDANDVLDRKIAKYTQAICQTRMDFDAKQKQQKHDNKVNDKNAKHQYWANTSVYGSVAEADKAINTTKGKIHGLNNQIKSLSKKLRNTKSPKARKAIRDRINSLKNKRSDYRTKLGY